MRPAEQRVENTPVLARLVLRSLELALVVLGVKLLVQERALTADRAELLAEDRVAWIPH